MGKITLGVLVLLIGLGVYWFYWEESGANAPITINYDLSIAGVQKQGNTYVKVEIGGNINFCAMQDRARLAANIDVKMQDKKITSFKITGIIRLDTNKIYLILPESKMYCEKDFDYVPLSDTEKSDSDKFDWLENFELKTDGEWFGSENEKYFARKQIPKGKEWDEAVKNIPGTKLELWFTGDSKLGSKYIKGLNKAFRIKMDLQKELAGLKASKTKTSDIKRPQLTRKDLPYFPIPLKIYFETRDPNTKAPVRITATAKEFSRKTPKKSLFVVPKSYEKVSFDKFAQEIMGKLMAAAMKQMIR